MMHSARRQILTDMGLTLWRLRVGAEEAVARDAEVPAQSAEAAPVARAPAEERPARTPAVKKPVRPQGPAAARVERAAVGGGDASISDGSQPGGEQGSGVRGQKTAPTPVEPTEAAPTPSAAEAPWTVLSLAVGGVVMLVDGGLGRRDQRLAQDVLAAAAGQWRARPVRRPFRWPPELGEAASVASAPDAGARALRAFIDKDLADHQATLLICTEAVHQRLTGDWSDGRLLVIPDLARLGADPQAKRTLWRTLAERAQESVR